jgi:hypothetical protein
MTRMPTCMPCWEDWFTAGVMCATLVFDSSSTHEAVRALHFFLPLWLYCICISFCATPLLQDAWMPGSIPVILLAAVC